jgi:hypothetical protein
VDYVKIILKGGRYDGRQEFIEEDGVTRPYWIDGLCYMPSGVSSEGVQVHTFDPEASKKQQQIRKEYYTHGSHPNPDG